MDHIWQVVVHAMGHDFTSNHALDTLSCFPRFLTRLQNWTSTRWWWGCTRGSCRSAYDNRPWQECWGMNRPCLTGGVEQAKGHDSTSNHTPDVHFCHPDFMINLQNHTFTRLWGCPGESCRSAHTDGLWQEYLVLHRPCLTGFVHIIIHSFTPTNTPDILSYHHVFL